MSKRKYKPVKRICSLADFESSKALWFESRASNKIKMWHRSALESLQVHTLMIFIKAGYIWECEKIEQNSCN